MYGPKSIYYIDQIFFNCILIDGIVKTNKSSNIYMSSKTNLRCLEKMSTKENWLSNIMGIIRGVKEGTNSLEKLWVVAYMHEIDLLKPTTPQTYIILVNL